MKMEQEIIKLYTNGQSISKILLLYPNYNRRQINKILQDNNITIRGGRKKKQLNSQQIKELKQMINEGAFLKDLAKHFQYDKETMRNYLKELNLSLKNSNRVNRRIRSDYFSKIDSPEKAYWLGFLFTDGSVDHYGHTGRIRLQLQERDKLILEQFKKDLQLDSKIIYDKRTNSTCCSVEFVDEQIYNDLKYYNIVPNKTYTITQIPYQKIPKQYLSAYALGLFDGDGNFYCDKTYSKEVTFGFTAYHESIVKDFQDIICSLTSLNKTTTPYFTSAWHINWSGRKQVLKILNVLYSNCPRHLNRKYNKYLELKNSLN